MIQLESVNPIESVQSKDEVQTRPFLQERQELIQEFERNYVNKLLLQTRGNVSEAARRAGVSRQALYGLFKRHEIDPRKFSRSMSLS